MSRLVFIFFLTGFFTVSAGIGESIERSLCNLETMVYGQVRLNESLESRFSRLETIIFGKDFHENNLDIRLTRLMKPFDFDESGTISLVAKINYLEWKLSSRCSDLPLLTKVSRLKKQTQGDNTLNDPLIFEVGKLCAVVFEGSDLEIQYIRLPENFELKAVLRTDLSSRHSRKDQLLEMELKTAVSTGEILIFPSGTTIRGKIGRAKRAELMGKNGRLNLVLEQILDLGNRECSLKLEQLGFTEDDKTGMAAGATLIGLAAFGPVGAVGGLFVKGKDVELKRGTEFILKVDIPDSVPGIRLKARE
ncbi:MAG: hypothetical protein PHW04_10650 [Candidatus Wallbacteria bacterium]|nr:hypothetical protein [Candidatus Wallbacteria bacterium]